MKTERSVKEIARDIYALVAKRNRRKLEALLKELARALIVDSHTEQDE